MRLPTLETVVGSEAALCQREGWGSLASRPCDQSHCRTVHGRWRVGWVRQSAGQDFCGDAPRKASHPHSRCQFSRSSATQGRARRGTVALGVELRRSLVVNGRPRILLCILSAQSSDRLSPGYEQPSALVSRGSQGVVCKRCQVMWLAESRILSPRPPPSTQTTTACILRGFL